MYTFELNGYIKELSGEDSPIKMGKELAGILSYDRTPDTKEKFFELAKQLINEKAISTDKATVLEIIEAIERSNTFALTGGQLIEKLRGYVTGEE